MKVTVETYVQHVSGMHFQLTYQPELLHGASHAWSSSRLHVEFNTIYHWHNMIPDYFLIGGEKTNKLYSSIVLHIFTAQERNLAQVFIIVSLLVTGEYQVVVFPLSVINGFHTRPHLAPLTGQ